MSRLFANNGRLDGTVAFTSNQCTIGAWVKRGASATDIAIHFGAAASPDGFYVQVTSTGVVQGIVSAAGSAISASASLAINDTTTWHLVVATVQDTGGGALKITVYADGANPGTQALTRTPALASVVRIAANLNGTGFWTGRIAHAFRYGVLLTPAEILSLYTNVPADVRRDALVLYDPLIQNRSPELDDVGGIELALTNATFDTDNPPIGPPTILTVGTVRKGASLTITGVVFKPGATNPTVTMGGVAQTVNTGSDTSITINSVARGNTKYGDQTVTVTNSLGLSDSIAVPFLPATGYAYVNLVAPLAPIEQRLAAIPELAGDVDQIEYGNIQGGVISDGLVLSDASHLWNEAVTAFDVAVWDGAWGSTSTQTLQEPVDPPVLTGVQIPVIPFNVGVPLNVFVGNYASGWATATIQGTAPGWLSLSGGTLVGTPTAAGIYHLSVRYANTAGNVDSNLFWLTFGVIRTRELVTSQSPPRRRRFAQ